MSFALRPFGERDWASVSTLVDEIAPFDPKGCREWLENRQQFDDAHHTRRHYLAENAETKEMVGYGSIEQQAEDSRRFRMYVVTAAENLRDGVGDLLFDHLIDDLDELNAATAWIREYRRDGDILTFFEERGFSQTRLVWDLRLSIGEVDVLPFLSITDRLAAQGIQITTLAEQRIEDTDWLPKFSNLYNTTMSDAPRNEPFRTVPPENFKRAVEKGMIIPEGCFIAKSGEAFIGFTSLKFAGDEDKDVYMGWTGVGKSYRQRGIATALKARLIEWAQRQGYRTVTTFNDDRNKEMLSANEKVGFRRHFGYVTQEKKL